MSSIVLVKPSDKVVKPNPNTLTKDFARNYFDQFCSLFQITGNGALRGTKVALRGIEVWFNNCYLFVSLITGVSLAPVHFHHDLGREDVAKKMENKVNLMHIYALSYTALLRFADTLHREVPAQFRPGIVDVDDVEEDLVI
jgi:hypothetical protein